jgi:hypothetical protein
LFLDMSTSLFFVSLSLSIFSLRKPSKMNLRLAHAGHRPLLAPHRATQARPRALPLVVRATASPKNHAESVARASKEGTTGISALTSSPSPSPSSAAATGAPRLPLTTALFVRALPGTLRV